MELNPSAQRCLTRFFYWGICSLNRAFRYICMENQQIHQLFIQFINYIWELLYVSPLHCHLQGGFLVPSERCSIENQSIEYYGWGCCASDVVRGAHHVTRKNTPIHNILSTASQLSISQKALGTLPEDDNVMPKHAESTICN